VLFKPYAPDIRDEIAGMDVVVLPSVRSEGLSRILIESMAMGIVVAASALPENQEAVGENLCEFLFPAGDYRALAALLERLRDNRNILIEKKPEMRKRAELLFDAEKNTKAVEAVYESLLVT
jgi:glycosyltransferase involved in cell wall biosynthesis